MSSLRKHLLSWLDSNELPWLPPRWWIGTAKEREVWALRREARRLMWPDWVAEHGRFRIFTRALVWPLWAGIKSFQHAHRNARTLYPGRSWFAVWADSYWLQLAYNIRISDQLDACLNLPENRREARGFTVCREQQVLLKRAYREASGVPGLQGKLGFARFCEANALPAPAPVCEGLGGEVTRGTDWPARDLIFKPANMAKGLGIAKLSHDAGAGVWRASDGSTVGPGTVGGWAAARLGEHAWLVQPFLRNASSLARFTTGGLATCRIVTGRAIPGGEPFLLGAFARFPLDHEAVDNLSAGGVGAGVDLADGTLTVGTIWVGERGLHERHPRTGAQIKGAALPGWPEMAALALRAHRAAGDWRSVGWDVALTPEGPVLIEANLHWSVLFHVPMSRTRIPEVLRVSARV
jgi:hypothetical protein